MIPWLVVVVFVVCFQSSAIPSPFEHSDDEFRKRTDESSARRARAGYLKLFNGDRAPEESAWRLAMANQFIGMRYAKTEEEKLTLFAEGREAARRCLDLNDRSAPCHFWYAINQALYGDTAGPLRTLSSLSTILYHLRQTVEIDPSYAYGGGYRVMGIIFQKLPGILGGSDQRAKENFEKAIQSSPAEPMNYLFLAKLLLQTNETSRGLEIARLGFEKKVTAPERVESMEALAELRRLLE